MAKFAHLQEILAEMALAQGRLHQSEPIDDDFAPVGA